MRRDFLCGCCAVLLLTSCGKKGDLPPSEVLRRAALASGQLRSARYDVQADVDGAMPAMSGRASIQLSGVLQDGGKEVQVAAAVEGEMDQEGEHRTLSLEGQAVTHTQNDWFFLLQQLNVEPPLDDRQNAMLTQVAGQWWRVENASDAEAFSVTPDPQLLRAQSEVVIVTRDNGVETINGHEAYRYDVAIDPDKLVVFMQKVSESNGSTFNAASAKADLANFEATGQMWIDTKTFYMHRLTWNVRTKLYAQGHGGLSIVLTANLKDHDAAPAIVEPQDARLFPRENFLRFALTGSSAILDGGPVPVDSFTEDSEPESLLDASFRHERELSGSGIELGEELQFQEEDSLLPLAP